MDPVELEKIFHAILPEATLRQLAIDCGLVERERKLDSVLFIREMVIVACTGYGGRQADVMRLYFEMGANKVVRSGFYRWFNDHFEKIMLLVSRIALDFCKNEVVDLPGWLGQYVRDWHIFDSTTIKLNKNLVDIYPSTNENAAMKVHKRISVGTGTLVAYHTSPARDHDFLHLHLDETWRGLGLLVDL